MTPRTVYLALPVVALALSTMTAAAQDSLRISLDPPSEARSGERVLITLRLENASSRPLDVYLRGRTITFDVVVTRQDGTVVWRRLEGEIIPAIVQLRTLAPREALEVHAEWDQRDNRGRRVAPGAYTLRGALLTDASTPRETAPAPLRITPR